METCAFGVDGDVLGNLDAGVSDEDIFRIFDIIEEELVTIDDYGPGIEAQRGAG